MYRMVCLAAIAFAALAGCAEQSPEGANYEYANPAEQSPAWFTLCGDERLPCDQRVVIANRNGVMVGVWPKRQHWKLYPIRERPNLARPDADLDLVQILPSDASKLSVPLRSNAYPLGRLQVGNSNPSFLTTSNEWPIVACAITMRDWVNCGVGLEIRGKFIEVSFSPEAKRTPTQREIWDLASAVDEEVRKRYPR